MSNSVLSLFEGMDEQQARKFRKAIENQVMPALWQLRADILAGREQGENKQRSQNGKMHSKNQRGATVQNANIEGQ
jgi:hypothetical protein